jgi:hypothetical protein
MQPFLDRISLVFHWAGFILSYCLFFIFIIFVFDHYDTEQYLARMKGEEIKSFFEVEQIFSSFVLMLLPLPITWILRYILSGNTLFIPIQNKNYRENFKFYNLLFLLIIPICFYLRFDIRFLLASIFG